MSVVFDFNASLNDVAPASPMSFTVDIIQHKSVKHTLVLKSVLNDIL